MIKTQKKRCTGTSKQSGKPCKKLPSVGMQVCEMHGGKSLKGFKSPSLKTGDHSKYLKHLPPSKQLRFNELADKPKEATVAERISLNELHLQELCRTLDDSTLFDNWREIRGKIRQLEDLILDPPDEDFEGFAPSVTPEMLFHKINLLFIKNEEAIKTWDKIHDINERGRRLEETNGKLRLQTLEEQTKRNELVPVEIFGKFVMEVSKQFELSPEDVRHIQMHGLSVAFNTLPPAIRQPPPELTSGE